MYTGRYRKPNQSTRQVLNVENLEGLHTGHLVALNVENCHLRPLIARVLSVTDMELEVVWLEGSYSRTWKVAKKKEGRAFIDWTDTVPITSVILYDFELTKGNRLRKATIQHLKMHIANLLAK